MKAAVPNIVLKTSLDEMALDKFSFDPFAESDDENERSPPPRTKGKTGNTTEFSLCLKAGRNPNNSLYYVDYNNAKNGCGLDRDLQNDLVSNLAKAQADANALRDSIKMVEIETTKLLSEPKNEEATAQIEIGTLDLTELKLELQNLQQFQGNEKHRAQLKRKTFAMTAEWRKRRRICLDFLISMEENTEGTISAKKCLSGDGPVDVESDELVVKNAIEYGKKKQKRPLGSKKANIRISSGTRQTSEILGDEAFIGVVLDSQGSVRRVHLEDD